MDVLTEFYNTDNGTTTKDYLSAGLTRLPSVYYNFSFIYLCFLGFWIAVFIKNKLSINRLNLLMGVLVVMKGLSLFCAATIQNHVKVTGNTLHGWDVMFHVCHLIQAVVLYIVTLLIIDGWYFLKPSLKEKKVNKVLMMVIPIQILATVGCIVGGEYSPFINTWMTWNMVLLTVQGICCYVIIINRAFLIFFFVETDDKTDQDEKVARKYVARFFIVTFGYVFLLFNLSFGEDWVSIRSAETTSLVFYLVMFCMFRPFETKKYIQLKAVEEDYELVGYTM